MSYDIVFETKIVRLKNGKILHLSLKGCNNDNCGRTRDDFIGELYNTEKDFIEYANSFKEDNKSFKETNSFELKIGSRYCTFYDYGEHLLRMLKRATTWDELKKHRISCYAEIFKGVEFNEKGKEPRILSPEEWDKIAYSVMYGKIQGSWHYILDYAYTEEKIIQSLENGDSMRFCISKKQVQKN